MTKQKKQMIVVSVLVLAVLAIGAFQFMGPKPSPVVADDGADGKKGEVIVAANTEDPVRRAIGMLLDEAGSPRDPFVPQAVLIDEEEQEHRPTPGFDQTQFTGQRPNTEIVGPLNPGVPTSTDTGLEPSLPLGTPYALRGVMLGQKNLAMIELTGGRQILVEEGEQFAAGSSVLAISEHEVVIKVNGTVKTLPLGGN